MEDQAFRRERMLASGLLREVSQDEAAVLARLMEAREAEQRPARALGQGSHDARDERAAGGQVAEESPFGEEVVGPHGARGRRPGRRRSRA